MAVLLSYYTHEYVMEQSPLLSLSLSLSLSSL